MSHPAWVHALLTEHDLDEIAAAVARVEAGSTAEVRVHLEHALPRGRDALGRAREVFRRLGMHKTRGRNAVLVYLSLETRKLAIVGDAGIHARVGDAYWTRLRDEMVRHLRAAAPRRAIVEAVDDLGRVLAEHFPRGPGDDPDELPNQVSID